MVGEAVLVFLGLFLIFGDGFAVEMFDDEEVDGDASLVAVAGPLRVLDVTISIALARAVLSGSIPLISLFRNAQHRSSRTAPQLFALSTTSRYR